MANWHWERRRSKTRNLKSPTDLRVAKSLRVKSLTSGCFLGRTGWWPLADSNIPISSAKLLEMIWNDLQMQKVQAVVPTCLSFKKGYGRPCDWPCLSWRRQVTWAPFNVTPGCRGALFRVDVDLCGLCAKKIIYGYGTHIELLKSTWRYARLHSLVPRDVFRSIPPGLARHHLVHGAIFESTAGAWKPEVHLQELPVK